MFINILRRIIINRIIIFLLIVITTIIILLRKGFGVDCNRIFTWRPWGLRFKDLRLLGF